MRDDGFVMFAALWIAVLLSGFSLAAGVRARSVVASAHHRQVLMAQRWSLDACLAVIRAAIDRALTDRGGGDPVSWARLDRQVPADAIESLGCKARLSPVAAGLDVNRVDSATVVSVLRYAGVVGARADSMAAALLDWRDADGAPRRLGAEAAWYRARGRPGPFDRPLEDDRELALIRGFEDGRASELFSTDSARLALSHLPQSVLLALPGIGPEAALALERIGERGGTVSVSVLANQLSEPAAARLGRSAGALGSMVAFAPDQWWLTLSVRSVGTEPAAVLRVRLAPHGDGATVVERWSELR